MKPLVSVLITVYNREKYVREAIESVLVSSFQDYELILVDDCSTDGSAKILKEYEQHEKIKIFYNKKNLGQFDNRNYAASLAEGKYIKFLDSDDIIYKYSLQYMVDIIQSFPNAAIAISHNLLHENKPYPIQLSPQKAYYSAFIGKGFPFSGPSATIISNQVFKEIGGFSKPYFVGSDIIMLLRLAAKYDIIKIPPALNWYRQHEGQALIQGIQSNEYISKEYFELKKLLEAEDCPLSDSNIVLAKKRLNKKFNKQLIKTLIKSLKVKMVLRLYLNKLIYDKK